MRGVLFLDFDGVLNNRLDRMIEPSGWNYLDQKRVERVNCIAERTGCAIVVSSSWRKENEQTPRTHVADLLDKAGATFPVLDVTPFRADHDHRCRGQGHADECGRGHEIQAWLDDHGWTGPTAIVDDGADMGHLLPYLVQTSDETGLLDEHVERICALLTTPPMREEKDRG